MNELTFINRIPSANSINFNSPISIDSTHISGGNLILVADSNNNRIVVLHEDGSYHSILTGRGRLSLPNYVKALSNGQICVTNSRNAFIIDSIDGDNIIIQFNIFENFKVIDFGNNEIYCVYDRITRDDCRGHIFRVIDLNNNFLRDVTLNIYDDITYIMIDGFTKDNRLIYHKETELFLRDQTIFSKQVIDRDTLRKILSGELSQELINSFISNNNEQIVMPYEKISSEISCSRSNYIVNLINNNKIIFINNDNIQAIKSGPYNMDINTISGIKFIREWIEAENGPLYRFSNISSFIMINDILWVVDSGQNCILLFNQKL